MGLIYHYCSLDTFTQVIKNRTIRLSDLDKTNDYMEKRWGIELLQEALKKELENNNIPMNLQEDYWYSDNAHNHIEQLNNDIDNYLNHQTLIACFSLERDQLSQWRAYGQDGEGIAIGFDYDCLKHLLKEQKELFIDKVAYRKNDQEKLIRKKMFVPALEYMRDMFQRESVRCSHHGKELKIIEYDVNREYGQLKCFYCDADVSFVNSYERNLGERKITVLIKIPFGKRKVLRHVVL